MKINFRNITAFKRVQNQSTAMRLLPEMKDKQAAAVKSSMLKPSFNIGVATGVASLGVLSATNSKLAPLKALGIGASVIFGTYLFKLNKNLGKPPKSK